MNLLYMKGRDYCTLSKSKTILFAAMAAATITLAACTDEDDSIPSSSGTPLQVQVSTAQPKTRALIESTTLPEGSIIGVSLVKTGGGDYGKGYPNMPYTATGTGTTQTWGAQAGEITLSSEKGTLYAYYPYSNQITDIKKIPVSTDTQTDYMYGETVLNVSEENPEANIVMRHALAAVRVLVKKGTYQGTGSLTKVAVTGEGYATSAMFDAVTAGLSDYKGAGTTQTMTINKTLDPSVYAQTDFILIPNKQNMPVTVALTVDDRTKTVDIPAWTMQQGYMYKIYLTVDDSEIEFKDISSDLWQYNDGGDITVDAGTYKINITGNLDNIAFNIEEQSGATVVTAAPTVGGEYVHQPEAIFEAGKAMLASNEFEGRQLVAIANQQTDIELVYNGTAAQVIRTVYNITTTDATRIIGQGNYGPYSKVSYLIIDGEKYIPSGNSESYIFSTTGEHTIDYILKGAETSIQDLFNGCSTLTEADFKNFNGSKITSVYELFQGCSSLHTIKLKDNQFPVVQDMTSLFNGCSSLKTIDINPFNNSNITKIAHLFNGCSSLTEIKGIEDLKVANLQQMNDVFLNCKSIKTLDLSSWNTSNWVGRQDGYGGIMSMFNGCSSLQSLNVSNWDVSKVYTMGFAFKNCNSLTELDLSNWKPSAARGMEQLFAECRNLEILNISNFDTSNVTNMGQMFYRCKKLSSLDLSHFNTAKVTNMEQMFEDCNSLATLNLSGWDTSSLTNMYMMFRWCNVLYELDLSSFNTSKVTTMSGCFWGTGGEKMKVLDISSFNTSNVTNMERMFCSFKLTDNNGQNIMLDLSHFNTSKVTNMKHMFYMGPAKINLTGWDTSNVTNMEGMFQHQNHSDVSFDVSHFKTSKVTNMGWMFDNVRHKTDFDLSGWDFSACTNMKFMFGFDGYNGICYPKTIRMMGDINPNVDVTNMFANKKTDNSIAYYNITLYYNANKQSAYQPIIDQAVLGGGTATPVNP